MEHNEAVIQMHGISKTFDLKKANTDVSFELYKGEIVSLLGENGSGKTTLMNMLAGIYFPDEGSIRVRGREVSIASPAQAAALGIGMVHQHFKLVDVFTAWENIALGESGKLDVADARARIRMSAPRYSTFTISTVCFWETDMS